MFLSYQRNRKYPKNLMYQIRRLFLKFHLILKFLTNLVIRKNQSFH